MGRGGATCVVPETVLTRWATNHRFYNSTSYSGLETHIANSYANPLLQLLRFTPLVRNLALSHTASACISESCMLCELGYLFDMLEKSKGSVCQATNMLRAISNHPAAQASGLLDEDPRGLTGTLVLQRLSRFLAERIVHDASSFPQQFARPFSQIVSMDMTMNQMCTNCRNGSETTRTSHVFDLQYPPMPHGLVRLFFFFLLIVYLIIVGGDLYKTWVR